MVTIESTERCNNLFGCRVYSSPKSSKAVDTAISERIPKKLRVKLFGAAKFGLIELRYAKLSYYLVKNPSLIILLSLLLNRWTSGLVDK